MDQDVVERLLPVDEVRLQGRIVQPRPDDLPPLRPQVHGEVLLEERVVDLVPAHPEVRAARVHPGVEDAVLPDELCARAVRAFVERGGVLPGAVVRPRLRDEGEVALLAVPQRDLRVVVPPPAHGPVDREGVDPVQEELPVAGRVERHLVRELPEGLPVVELLQVPRLLGEELHGGPAPLADRGLVLDRLRLLEDPVGLEGQEDLRPRLLDGQARKGPCDLRHPALHVDRLHGVELELPEEADVHHVPVRADHRGAAPEVRVRLRMRDDRDGPAKDRDRRGLPHRPGPSRVARVHDHGAARGEQLGAGRRDRHGAPALEGELDPREGGRELLVQDVRLRERRAARDAVERRPLPPVEQPLVEQVDEDPLAVRAVRVGIRVVRVREVHRHPHPAGDVEDPLPDAGDLLPALRDELLAVPLVERLPVLSLHRPLDVDPVPVKPHREEDRLPEHPLGPRDHVDQGVPDDGPRVPVPARVRGRGVDHERGPAVRVERVQGGLPGPRRDELLLDREVPLFPLQLRFGHGRCRLVRSRG